MRRVVATAVTLLMVLAANQPAGAASGATKKLAEAQRKANAAAARLSAAQSALARAERQEKDLRSRMNTTRKKLGDLELQVRALAVKQYVEGWGGSAPWLNATDLQSAARGQAMLRFVTLGSQDAVDAYRAAREDLADGQAAMERVLADRRSSISLLRAKRTAALRELNRLAALQKAENRRRGRGGISGRVVLIGGNWICPVAGPHSFANDWGAPRSGGRRHQGNDILGPRGTPVVASVAGTVRHRNSGLGGKAYYLVGDDGNTYYGAHLQAYGASGRVSRGTVVGSVGSTGNASGGPPHLHFEIHPGGGRAVNPYPTLRAHC